MIENFKNAFISIWSNKVRSVLTVLGVVIGVASVTTLISLGQGLKNDVSTLIRGFGTNVMFITSGNIPTNPTQGQAGANPANFISGDILTLSDVKLLEQRDDLSAVTPLSLVPGALKYEEKQATATIFGTYPNITDALEVLKLEKGNMFADQSNEHVLIIGDVPREALFGDTDPINKKVLVGKEEFTVIGTFAKAKSSSALGSEFDSMVVIPFNVATQLNKNQVKINRIALKATDTSKVDSLKSEIKKQLIANHDGEEDFSILTQDDILDLFGTFLTLATTLVSAIASISLIVGGVGIMNIMLVTVTERTREIGLRKAVGATRGAILWQFLIEAIVVTFLGSLIGLIISFAVGALVAWQTDLNAAITPAVIGAAVGISIIVGIIFGLWPAIRASKKDPIEALRYE
jgi:putative ABC transport system permease protein